MFQQFKQKQISMVMVQGVGDTDIKKGAQKMTWDEFAQSASRFIKSPNKNVLSVLPVILKPEQEWVRGESNLINGKEKTYRNKNNMTHVTMAVVDLDEKGALEQAQKKFAGVEKIVHSTFSYSPTTPYKYRMIMPLENPIPVEQWERTFVNLMAGIDGDYACKNVSRGYHMPTVNTEHNIDGVFIRESGKNLTQEMIMDLAEQHMDVKAKEALKKIENKGEVKKTASLHPSGMLIESTYNGDSLSYEGFSRRHSKKVDMCFDGGKGSRHDFAMQVLNSEIGIFKEKARLDLAIEYIFKATLENSTHPLSIGNTADEIPELIESATAIMVPSQFLKDEGFKASLIEQIKTGIKNSLNAEKNGGWSFEQYAHEPKVLGNSLKSYNARYFREIAAFEKACQSVVLEGNDAAAKNKIKMSAFKDNVVLPVLRREVSSNKNIDIQSMGRFFFEMVKDNSIGNNPTSTYANIAKSLALKIHDLNVPALQSQGLTKEDMVEQMNEVILLSPIIQSVENDNKKKFKKKAEASPEPK